VCPVPLVPGPNPASLHAKLVDDQKDFIQEQRLELKIWIGLTLLGAALLAEREQHSRETSGPQDAAVATRRSP